MTLSKSASRHLQGADEYLQALTTSDQHVTCELFSDGNLDLSCGRRL